MRLALIAAVAGAALLAGGSAFAQTAAGPVAVLNSERVLAQSAAGQDMRTKIQAIEQTLSREIEPEAQRLQRQQETLQGQVAQRRQQGQTQQQIEQDQTLRTQLTTLQRDLSALETKRVQLSRDLSFTTECAVQSFNELVDPVVDQLMTERGIQVILQAGSVAKVRTAADVTDEVLRRLNERTRTMNIVRLTAPPPPQPGQPGPRCPDRPR